MIRRSWMAVGVVLALGASACNPRTPEAEDLNMSGKSLRILALGDSYTIGERVDSALRWPVQLARALDSLGVAAEDPVVVAQTGWTTDELMAGIDEVRIEGPYDLVTLLIGVNNQYRGRGLEEYRVQVAELLDRAVGFAGDRPERVLVLSIPDWGVTPFAEGRDRPAIASEIDAFNRVKAEECEAGGVRFLDITDISREAADDSSLVAADGLHPSGAMYGRWVERALTEVRSMLGLEEVR